MVSSFRLHCLKTAVFFADLVLRQVRAGGDPSSGLSERDSSRKKLNVVRVAPAPPQSRANSVLGQRREEPALQPETLSFVLQTLWIEVGCRHVQTLVSEKERP
jgi:hypothetical protein